MRKTVHNSVYVAIAGEVVNRRSVLLRNIVVNVQVSASNPLLHIHANRCVLFIKCRTIPKIDNKKIAGKVKAENLLE